MKQTGTYSRLCKEGRYANALCPTDFNFSQVKTLQKKTSGKTSVCITSWLRKQTARLFVLGYWLLSKWSILSTTEQPVQFQLYPIIRIHCHTSKSLIESNSSWSITACYRLSSTSVTKTATRKKSWLLIGIHGNTYKLWSLMSPLKA